jgi:hypothetical protein
MLIRRPGVAVAHGSHGIPSRPGVGRICLLPPTGVGRGWRDAPAMTWWIGVGPRRRAEECREVGAITTLDLVHPILCRSILGPVWYHTASASLDLRKSAGQVTIAIQSAAPVSTRGRWHADAPMRHRQPCLPYPPRSASPLFWSNRTLTRAMSSSHPQYRSPHSLAAFTARLLARQLCFCHA